MDTHGGMSFQDGNQCRESHDQLFVQDSHCMCTRYYLTIRHEICARIHLFAIGYLLGGAFGIFTAGLDPAITDDPTKQTARQALKEMPEREFICQELCCGWRHV